MGVGTALGFRRIRSHIDVTPSSCQYVLLSSHPRATIFLWFCLHSEPDHQQRWPLCLFYIFLTPPFFGTRGSEATFSQDGSLPLRVPSVLRAGYEIRFLQGQFIAQNSSLCISAGKRISSQRLHFIFTRS